MIHGEVLLAIENIARQHAEQVKQLDDIIALCGADAGRPSSIDGNSPLARMLID